MDSSGRRRSNLCVHNRESTVRNDISVHNWEVRQSDSGPTDGDYRYRFEGPGAFWFTWDHKFGTIRNDNIVVEFPEHVSRSIEKAIHNFHNVNEVDTLLNIVESPKLISGLRSVLKGGSKTSFLKRLRRGDGSNAYLYYSFGLAPLISDMQKIRKAMVAVKADIDRQLRALRGQRVSHYSCFGQFTGFTGMGSGFGAPDNNDNSYWHSALQSVRAPRRVITCRGSWAARYNSDLLNRLDYLLRRFLSAGPASYVWERIPFSFVVDWFLDLSSIIDGLDRLLTGSDSSISDVCLSESWRVQCPIYKHKRALQVSSFDNQQVGINDLVYYRREPQIVAPSQVQLSGRFGKKQLSLAAALLHQILANRKR